MIIIIGHPHIHVPGIADLGQLLGWSMSQRVSRPISSYRVQRDESVKTVPYESINRMSPAEWTIEYRPIGSPVVGGGGGRSMVGARWWALVVGDGFGLGWWAPVAGPVVRWPVDGAAVVCVGGGRHQCRPGWVGGCPRAFSRSRSVTVNQRVDRTRLTGSTPVECGPFLGRHVCAIMWADRRHGNDCQSYAWPFQTIAHCISSILIIYTRCSLDHINSIFNVIVSIIYTQSSML